MRIFEKYPPSVVIFALLVGGLTLTAGLEFALLVVAAYIAGQRLDHFGL